MEPPCSFSSLRTARLLALLILVSFASAENRSFGSRQAIVETVRHPDNSESIMDVVPYLTRVGRTKRAAVKTRQDSAAPESKHPQKDRRARNYEADDDKQEYDGPYVFTQLFGPPYEVGYLRSPEPSKHMYDDYLQFVRSWSSASKDAVDAEIQANPEAIKYYKSSAGQYSDSYSSDYKAPVPHTSDYGKKDGKGEYETSKYEKPAYSEPSYDKKETYAPPQPAHKEPSYEAPAYSEKSSYGKESYSSSKPAYEAPYEKDYKPTPSYTEPKAYEAPKTYDEPKAYKPAVKEYDEPKPYLPSKYEVPKETYDTKVNSYVPSKSGYETPKHHIPKYDTPKYEAPKYDTANYEAPKYEAPKYEAPKYDEPKYQAPKYEEPKYQEPKYEASKYEEPKYEAPKYEEPKYEAPKYEAPKYQQPKYEAPKYEEPKYEEPKYQAPKYENPKYEEPKYQAPKYEEPKYEEPKYEAPKYETPKYEEPKHQAPKYEEPKYQAPKYQAPKYEEPKYEEPKYQAPKYEEPKYEAPKYEATKTYDAPKYEAPKYAPAKYGTYEEPKSYMEPKYEPVKEVYEPLKPSYDAYDTPKDSYKPSRDHVSYSQPSYKAGYASASYEDSTPSYKESYTSPAYKESYSSPVYKDTYSTTPAYKETYSSPAYKESYATPAYKDDYASPVYKDTSAYSPSSYKETYPAPSYSSSPKGYSDPTYSKDSYDEKYELSSSNYKQSTKNTQKGDYKESAKGDEHTTRKPLYPVIIGRYQVTDSKAFLPIKVDGKGNDHGGSYSPSHGSTGGSHSAPNSNGEEYVVYYLPYGQPLPVPLKKRDTKNSAPIAKVRRSAEAQYYPVQNLINGSAQTATYPSSYYYPESSAQTLQPETVTNVPTQQENTENPSSSNSSSSTLLTTILPPLTTLSDVEIVDLDVVLADVRSSKAPILNTESPNIPEIPEDSTTTATAPVTTSQSSDNETTSEKTEELNPVDLNILTELKTDEIVVDSASMDPSNFVISETTEEVALDAIPVQPAHSESVTNGTQTSENFMTTERTAQDSPHEESFVTSEVPSVSSEATTTVTTPSSPNTEKATLFTTLVEELTTIHSIPTTVSLAQEAKANEFAASSTSLPDSDITTTTTAATTTSEEPVTTTTSTTTASPTTVTEDFDSSSEEDESEEAENILPDSRTNSTNVENFMAESTPTSIPSAADDEEAKYSSEENESYEDEEEDEEESAENEKENFKNKESVRSSTVSYQENKGERILPGLTQRPVKYIKPPGITSREQKHWNGYSTWWTKLGSKVAKAYDYE